MILAGVILAGIGGFGSWYFGKALQDEKDTAAGTREGNLHRQVTELVERSEVLEAQLRPFTELAHEKFPRLDEQDALGLLREEIEKERATVRSLEAELEISFSGRWSEAPYPGQMLSPVSDEYYIALLPPSGSDAPIVRFYATEIYRFEDTAPGRAVFRARQAVHAGEPPMGENVSVFAEYKMIQFLVPILLADHLEDGQITIERIDASFIVNGVRTQGLAIEPNSAVPVRYPEGSKLQAWATILYSLDNSVDSLFVKPS